MRPLSAFDELVRVLEPGGILMFTRGHHGLGRKGFRTALENLVQSDKLRAVETTPIYCPMPYSATESGFTTRAHVYRKA